MASSRAPALASLEGVVLRFSRASYVRALALRKTGLGRQALLAAPLSLERYAPAPLPGPHWVRVAMSLAGICGSDLGILRATLSAQLSPFASFPSVMGHEGTGVVTEAGPGAGIPLGSRVVVDPFLGCAVRGLSLCRACAAGLPALCERSAEGPFSPGMLLGTCRDLPGTWSREVLAHRSQVHRVPDALTDEAAVLVEPLAVSLRAVLEAAPQPVERIAVIGAGSIGLLTVAAVRLLGLGNPVLLIHRHPHQERLGRAMGADETAPDTAALDAAGEFSSARLLTALDGRAVLAGGVDATLVAVGTARGLDLGLRLTRPGGRIVLVGSPGVLASLDLTGVWAKGIRVLGTLGYGPEPTAGGRHTFDLAMELLASPGRPPIETLITHRFPLEDYRRALSAFTARGAARPVKVVLDTRSGASLEGQRAAPLLGRGAVNGGAAAGTG